MKAASAFCQLPPPGCRSMFCDDGIEPCCVSNSQNSVHVAGMAGHVCAKKLPATIACAQERAVCSVTLSKVNGVLTGGTPAVERSLLIWFSQAMSVALGRAIWIEP